MIYGVLKSSDLNGGVVTSYRKSMIVTQKKTGQKTDYIRGDYPLTYKYLSENSSYFLKRKSTIYKGKPLFSIFGIGPYSFKPFKVAISGMYKKTRFTLILSEKEKPIMLDDTCYFIGFDNPAYAKIAHFLLNHEICQKFLKSIVFSDAKRSITKEVLMRIDLIKLFNIVDFEHVKEVLRISKDTWTDFGKLISSNTSEKQLTLF